MRTVHKLVAAVAVLPTVVVCLALVAVAGSGPHATPDWRYPVMPWQAAYLNLTNDHEDHQPSQTGSLGMTEAHVRRIEETNNNHGFGSFGNVANRPQATASSWTFSRMQTTTAGKDLSTLRVPVTQPAHTLDSEQVVHNLGDGGRVTPNIHGTVPCTLSCID